MRTILPVKSCRENNQGQIRGQYGGLTTDESADNRARKVERITNSSATGLALGEIPPHPPSGQIVGQLLVCGGWPWGEIPPHPRAGKSWGNCWCGPHFTLEYRHHYRISLFPSQFYSICESLQETTWGDVRPPRPPREFVTVGLLGFVTVGLLGFVTVGLLGFVTVGLLGFVTVGLLGFVTVGCDSILLFEI